jgi:uncharacterized membrane protein
MKVLCTDHIDVAVPADRVYGFAVDISRWPLWFSPVVCAQHPDGCDLAVNQELLLCLHAGRRRWQERFEVTRLVSNAFLSLEGAYSAARRIDFRFEQRGAQTRVACSIGYRVFGGALAGMLDAVFRRPRVRNEVRDSLHRLKGLLEERAEQFGIDEDARLPDVMDAATASDAMQPAEPAHVG